MSERKQNSPCTLNDAYKPTELGPLPQEWEVVRLRKVIKEIKIKNKANEKYPVYSVSNKYGFILSDEFFDKQVYSCII